MLRELKERRSMSDYNVCAKITKTLKEHKDVICIWGGGGSK
jgi:hypothetical protein